MRYSLAECLLGYGTMDVVEQLVQQVPIAPQFAAASGQIALGYVLPWFHSASATHSLYAPVNNVWHYHSHLERPAGNHFSTTPLDTGNGRKHVVLRIVNYGVQAQFFRSY